MVRLSMLDSVADSNEDSSSCFGSISGFVPEEDEKEAARGGDADPQAPITPVALPVEALSDRAVGLGHGEFFYSFAEASFCLFLLSLF